jgi:hypothetical protein
MEFNVLIFSCFNRFYETVNCNKLKIKKKIAFWRKTVVWR